MSESKSKTISVLVLVGILFFLVFGANAWKSNLRVKQINIEGNRLVGTNEILQLTQVHYGSLLYEVDLSRIQNNIMSHYYIKDALVERNLPNTIHVQIVERIPIAMINGEGPLYVDQEGIVLPRTVSRKLFDLPMISGLNITERVVVGSKLTRPDLRESLQLLSVLKALNRPMYHNISEVQVHNGGDIILYAAEGGIPIIFGHGDIPGKLARLEVFWNEIVRSRGPQNLQYIDVRYQDQVVAKWNAESSTSTKEVHKEFAPKKKQRN